MLPGYWYFGEGGLNYGDALNPLLVRRLTGVILQWTAPPQARLFAIGSNIELIPEGYTGTIFGTGIMRADTRRDLSGARVLAVRGNLTAAVCNLDGAFLADPALLAPLLLADRPEPDIDHGFIRHYGDHRKVQGYAIDVLGGPEHVTREVARCRRITSSSLHGLVLADALGIKNRWSPHRATPQVKFSDYASAYGEAIKPYVWRLADQEQVAQKQAALRELLDEAVA
jgi:pyruvyltransferase